MNIKKDDIIKIISLEEYNEIGDEITDLVKEFADDTLIVDSVSEDTNEFGERTVTAHNHKGSCTFTEHEIKYSVD